MCGFDIMLMINARSYAKEFKNKDLTFKECFIMFAERLKKGIYPK